MPKRPNLCFEPIAEQRFLAGHRHWWLKLTIGQMIQTFLRTADADIFFDDVVVRRDVLLTQRPIFPEAVVRRGFEIQVAEP